MAGNCFYHSGRSAAGTRFGESYCQTCLDGIDRARAQVPGYVEPGECFLWLVSNDNFQPLSHTHPGTCCAHYVAHKKGIRWTSGSTCIAGFPFRVRDLYRSGPKITDLSKVRVGDIMFHGDLGHCGIVVAVKERSIDVNDPNRFVITIAHCSSRQGRTGPDDLSHFLKEKPFFQRR